MPTYPLSFPAIGVVRSSFRLQQVISETASPFTGAQQVHEHPGAWFEGEVTFRPTRGADAGIIKAFLAALRGKYGTFVYGDPDALALGRMGAGGTILVKGAGQTGNSLAVDGMTPSTSNILKPGDYFQIGSGAFSRLHLVTEALNSDGSGEGTLVFEPTLRSSPADNAAISTTSPKGVFRLAENGIPWDSDQSCIQEVTIAFREALSV